MKFRELITSTLFFKSIFAFAILCFLFIAALMYRQVALLDDASQSVAHSYQVRLKLTQFFSGLKTIESEQRGFLLTRDSVFLDSVRSMIPRIEQINLDLRSLTTDNPEQQNNLVTLGELKKKRLAVLDDLIKTYRNDLSDSAKTALINVGRLLTSDIRENVRKMVVIEDKLLESRQKEHGDMLSVTPVVSLALILFGLLVIILLFAKIMRELGLRNTINNELHELNHAFAQAEVLAGISHWRWNLKTNVLTYSDNVFRMLGCEPQSFVPSVSTIEQFIHPEDKKFISDRKNKVIQEGAAPLAIYRIIRKDGEVRYFKSTGTVMTNSFDEKMLIGINQDITESQLDRMQLEEKNRSLDEINSQLEQSNTELASFNYIASHDLQEPLRKVMMYISRLIEIESSEISASGKEYLDKIRIAAARMQKLIDDLLIFSRTSTDERSYEYLDLNDLFAKVKDDCRHLIEEKKAVIESALLPKIKVVGYQFEQLFTNLLTNSLKYSRADAAPLIRVGCIIVNEQEPQKLNNPGSNTFYSYGQYYKISFADNGIGFEEQYSERIFRLFQRLHGRTEYTGTGVGLAICKKIVENHNGFINATAKPGEGATFNIFIPINNKGV